MSKVLLHELGKSLSYGRLSLLAKVLWPMLLASSDDQGRGTAEADAIKWYVCPNVPEITEDKVSALLQEMIDLGMIVLYVCDREMMAYQVVRWWEYQSLRWARPSRFSAPENWTDRIRYSNRGQIFQKDWKEAGGFSTEPRVELPTEDYIEDCTENSRDFQPNPTTTQPKQQPNPTQPNPTTTPDVQPGAQTTGELPDVVVALLQEVLTIGVTQNKAQEIAQDCKPEDVRGWLHVLRNDNGSIRSPAAFLVSKLLIEREPPPVARAPPAAITKEQRHSYAIPGVTMPIVEQEVPP